MTGGWIAFTILLAYIAGIVTALFWGHWAKKKFEETERKEKYGEY